MGTACRLLLDDQKISRCLEHVLGLKENIKNVVGNVAGNLFIQTVIASMLDIR